MICSLVCSAEGPQPCLGLALMRPHNKTNAAAYAAKKEVKSFSGDIGVTLSLAMLV